jgi:SAM-dependent methyltransferase
MDLTNRNIWQSARVLDAFARRRGWSDPGEERAMQLCAEEARGEPILDIGVGAGRTLPYLRSLSEDYVAVDYLPEMVNATRGRFPDARIEHADARDLHAFADASFALVVFSMNGIDGLAHEDRRKVHAAVKRVLRPGGAFIYSTHNLEHPSAGRPPWDRCRLPGHITMRPLLAWAVRLPRRSRSYRRLRALIVRGESWAVLVGASYDFGIVGHYLTLDEALRELSESGFAADVHVYGSSGDELCHGSDTRDSEWFHLIARKPISDAQAPATG